MLKVEIESAELRTQAYTDKKGQPATLSFQTGYVFTTDDAGKVGRYPEKLEFIAERDQTTNRPVAYAPGDYTLHPSALYIDRDGRLAARMRLAPLKRSAA